MTRRRKPALTRFGLRTSRAIINAFGKDWFDVKELPAVAGAIRRLAGEAVVPVPLQEKCHAQWVRFWIHF
jgi:hypothetical protein